MRPISVPGNGGGTVGGSRQGRHSWGYTHKVVLRVQDFFRARVDAIIEVVVARLHQPANHIVRASALGGFGANVFHAQLYSVTERLWPLDLRRVFGTEGAHRKCDDDAARYDARRRGS